MQNWLKLTKEAKSTKSGKFLLEVWQCFRTHKADTLWGKLSYHFQLSMAIHIYSGSIRTKRATIRYHFRHLRLILAVFGSFLLNVILVACKHLQTAKTLLPHHFQLVTSIYSHSLQVSGLIEFGLSWCWTFWLFWLIFDQSQPSTLKIPKEVLLHHFLICLTIYSHSGIIRTKRAREVLYFGNLGTGLAIIG